MLHVTLSALVLAVLLPHQRLASPELLDQSVSCAVTAPNHNVPPDTVLARAGISTASGAQTTDMWHGAGGVWTSLWMDGAVVFKKGGPGSILPDGSLRMKFLWVLAGDGPLAVDGRRLDAAAQALTAVISPGFVGRGFQPSYLIFPTVGCWEVTARANGSTLTFVTTVVKRDL
jgi:hypothetical protein